VADARYARLLRAADLELLAVVAGRDVEAGSLKADPARVAAVVRRPAVYRALFEGAGRDPLLVASPFLVFAVLVEQVARDLAAATFVDELVGHGRTVPVFDVAGLREFLADDGRRAFLAELLASYTRVASGTVWQRTPRGWRRRRYSDLDPLRLAQLLEVAPEAQRLGICRRLGDLALFLSGVFPEHAASHPLEARHVERIRRLLDATGLGPPAPSPDELAMTGSAQRGIWLLEWLGRHAYRLAARGGDAAAAELRDVAAGFSRARRVLNVLTSRHLYPSRDRWFPRSGDG
jgi:hypothetical protein